jgi:beta-RFAP synthase
VAAEATTAEGPEADRARLFATAAIRSLGLPDGAHVQVQRAIEPHRGLGSGTKLGLAIASGLATLHGVAATTGTLATAVARGERSAVGVWTFDAPGLVLEGGPRRDVAAPGPLLGRWEMPAAWRCVLALPRGGAGMSGSRERAFFAEAGSRTSPRIAQIVLTSLLPALLEDDIAEFGGALSRLQRIVGSAFAPAQGGVFHPLTAPLIEAMERLGVPGVGQSSWGPAAYGIVEDAERADWVVDRLRADFGGTAVLTAVDFDRRGPQRDLA